MIDAVDKVVEQLCLSVNISQVRFSFFLSSTTGQLMFGQPPFLLFQREGEVFPLDVNLTEAYWCFLACQKFQVLVTKLLMA